ncbi:hypothetical protein A3A66_04195 [Microgenomates group bacterium RIFCSPLOWO2_01_FULL_46_13]|nr:MAG: hypothetical protein A2783_03665 [Microgenomates group bacterium RIFCSPHIGHO2_01_FULL_45_11]OGV94985.1 MAG: hypothetical protein A3A66_04195 [Microgenomates group bacterium RIFCSPLOWO2_01_FULL_46_13]
MTFPDQTPDYPKLSPEALTEIINQAILKATDGDPARIQELTKNLETLIWLETLPQDTRDFLVELLRLPPYHQP